MLALPGASFSRQCLRSLGSISNGLGGFLVLSELRLQRLHPHISEGLAVIGEQAARGDLLKFDEEFRELRVVEIERALPLVLERPIEDGFLLHQVGGLGDLRLIRAGHGLARLGGELGGRSDDGQVLKRRINPRTLQRVSSAETAGNAHLFELVMQSRAVGTARRGISPLHQLAELLLAEKGFG